MVEPTTESLLVIDTVNGVRPLAASIIQTASSTDKNSPKLSINSVLVASEENSNREKFESQIASSFAPYREVLPADIGEWHGRANDSISVKRADGTELPKWLFERDGRLIVKERPADVEFVYLQVRMTSSQGISELVFMRLNVITGELTAVAPEDARKRKRSARHRQKSAPTVPAETLKGYANEPPEVMHQRFSSSLEPTRRGAPE